MTNEKLTRRPSATGDRPLIPEHVARDIAESETHIYWDYRDSLSREQVADLLSGKRDLWEIETEILDYNLDYIWELENDTITARLKQYGIAADWRDFRDQYPDTRPLVKTNIETLLRNSHDFVSLILNLDGPSDPEAPHLRAADLAEQCEFFGVDLTLLSLYVRIAPDPVLTPCRLDEPAAAVDVSAPAVAPEDLAETWINTFYRLTWAVMLAHQKLLAVLNHREDILTHGVTLQSGTNLIIHDYVNGASSTPVTLIRDLTVTPEDLSGLDADGPRKYGIQSCCSFIPRAWDGRWTLRTPAERHETFRPAQGR